MFRSTTYRYKHLGDLQQMRPLQLTQLNGAHICTTLMPESSHRQYPALDSYIPRFTVQVHR